MRGDPKNSRGVGKREGKVATTGSVDKHVVAVSVSAHASEKL